MLPDDPADAGADVPLRVSTLPNTPAECRADVNLQASADRLKESLLLSRPLRCSMNGTKHNGTPVFECSHFAGKCRVQAAPVSDYKQYNKRSWVTSAQRATGCHARIRPSRLEKATRTCVSG
ncbi:hypothetical protein O3P69_013661 [Scylla paramamosain]|uniref:Uncharacterized protein n=1 Tax=Scylla paramamosain TaxID=85552 RepID=A0AAW0SSJ5_SCYPA